MSHPCSGHWGFSIYTCMLWMIYIWSFFLFFQIPQNDYRNLSFIFISCPAEDIIIYIYFTNLTFPLAAKTYIFTRTENLDFTIIRLMLLTIHHEMLNPDCFEKKKKNKKKKQYCKILSKHCFPSQILSISTGILFTQKQERTRARETYTL